MKKIMLMAVLTAAATGVFAQVDSTGKENKEDTIRVGGMIIVKQGGRSGSESLPSRVKKKARNLSTAKWIFDIGFANWTDNTNYFNATAKGYFVNKPGSPNINPTDLKLRSGKSSNVNIWLFMQRLNLVKHYFNLKYGLGVELNNYRFNSNITFKEGGDDPYSAGQQAIPHMFILRDSVSFTKNKLAADYATVPFMLNFQTNPRSPSKGLSISAGVSVGYLYSSRNKQVSAERGKHHNKGEYDLEKWKFSYVGELGLGPVRLYGSYSPRSIFKGELNMTPYAVGVRLSNW